MSYGVLGAPRPVTPTSSRPRAWPAPYPTIRPTAAEQRAAYRAIGAPVPRELRALRVLLRSLGA